MAPRSPLDSNPGDAGRNLPEIDFTNVPIPRGGPWVRGTATVAIEEHRTPDGDWSMYCMQGGKVATLARSIDSVPSVAFALFILWRAVANVTQVCPICGEPARLTDPVDRVGEGFATHAVIEHSPYCLVDDVTLMASREDSITGSPLPAGLPAGDRTWIVRPPRIRKDGGGAS